MIAHRQLRTLYILSKFDNHRRPVEGWFSYDVGCKRVSIKTFQTYAQPMCLRLLKGGCLLVFHRFVCAVELYTIILLIIVLYSRR